MSELNNYGHNSDENEVDVGSPHARAEIRGGGAEVDAEGGVDDNLKIVERPSPLNGVFPPKEYRWQKGQSGGGRRPAAGISLREGLNILQDYTEAELQKIINDPKMSAVRKAAAKSWLNAVAYGAKDACNSISDLTIGKPRQSFEISAVDPFNNDGNIEISPETIALQNRLAKQLEKRKEQQALPPPSQ